jgi:hypothetical protein
MKESNMSEDHATKRTTNEQAALMRAWGSMGRVADDALTALETGNAKQVREHLEVIQGVATKKARHMRTWRKMVWLAEDALSAINAGNETMVREYLAAIRAVAQCAQEA